MTALAVAYDRSPKTQGDLIKDFDLMSGICRPACVSMIKIGIEAIHCEFRDRSGSQVVVGQHMRNYIRTFHRGVFVLWDVKFHDIGRSAAAAVRNLAGNVDAATLHASMNPAALREVVKTRDEAAGTDPTRKTKLYGVTVLSDFDDTDCTIVYGADCETKVLQFAHQLIDCGIDGIVCSGLELQTLANAGLTEKLKTLVVGGRPDWAEKNDLRRVMTPREIAGLGADYAVFGRPIFNGPHDPVRAAGLIYNEMAYG